MSITHPRLTLGCHLTQEPHVILIQYRDVSQLCRDVHVPISLIFKLGNTRRAHGRVCDPRWELPPCEAHHERQSPHAIGQFTPAFAYPINTHHPARGIARQRSPMGVLNVRWEAIARVSIPRVSNSITRQVCWASQKRW